MKKIDQEERKEFGKRLIQSDAFQNQPYEDFLSWFVYPEGKGQQDFVDEFDYEHWEEEVPGYYLDSDNVVGFELWSMDHNENKGYTSFDICFKYENNKSFIVQFTDNGKEFDETLNKGLDEIKEIDWS